MSCLEKTKKLSLVKLSELENYLYIVGNFNEKILQILDKDFTHQIKNHVSKTSIELKGLTKIESLKNSLYCLQHQYSIGTYNARNNCLLLLLKNILDSIFFKTLEQKNNMVI